jgi:hypothetical protein
MSPNDMGRHIHAVLNHRQLSSLVTRRWLKPTSHTADLRSSVGAPVSDSFFGVLYVGHLLFATNQNYLQWEIKRVTGLNQYHTIDVREPFLVVFI